MASANQNIQEPISTAVHGRVKWFNVKAGYGFIKRNDNNDDIFVHKASILRPNPNHMIPSLDDSEEVVFDIIQSPKGFEAVNVTGPGRANVVGNSRAHRRHRRGSGRAYYGAGGGGVLGVYLRDGRGGGRDMYQDEGAITNRDGGAGYFRGGGRGSRGGPFAGTRNNYYAGPRMRGAGRGGAAPGMNNRLGSNHFSSMSTGRFNESPGNY